MGFPPEGAAMLLLRAELAIEVEKFVRRNNLTPSAAAERLGVSQPRVNDLLRHKIDRFRVDTLLAMLWRAGLRVEMRVVDLTQYDQRRNNRGR
jgi:predicted XRE-type DNA-binding protein